jgi:hypothetical protein
MPIKGASQKAKSDNVFGRARKGPKMLRAGLYARVSTNDQQTLAMQSRAMREYAARRGWTITMQVRGSTRGRRSEKPARNYWKPPDGGRSTWCWSGDWIAGAAP